MASISETPRGRVLSLRPRHYGMAAAGLALAALGVGMAVSFRTHARASEYAHAVAEIRQAWVAGGVLVSGSFREGNSGAMSLDGVSPFGSEVQALTHDARSAARFLARCVAIDVPEGPADVPRGGR